MENKKEFHYKESDIKGSPNLIEDCKNHYVHKLTTSNESDLDIILDGINQNESDLDILKKLPNVTCDNIYSIMSGIKAIRHNTPVNEVLAFESHFTQVLASYGFNFDKMLNQSKAKFKAYRTAEARSLLYDVVELFVKFCEKQNYDIIDILLS